MEAQNSTVASRIASSSTARDPKNSDCCYDVFISHHGRDTKKTLASHLYYLLQAHGYRAFLDQKNMRAGDRVDEQLMDVIRLASCHVAIFSVGYSESKWCLDELKFMLESKVPIIPVFYHVEPAELKRENGVYAQGLHKLQMKTTDGSSQQIRKKRRYDDTRIKEWREALFSAAEISGLELTTFNGDEGLLVNEVVQLVKRIAMAKSIRLPVAKYPTGLKEKVEEFERMVLSHQLSGKVKIVGITGLGGVGKTTLAKELFNLNRSKYNKSVFLSDVRGKHARSSLEDLQIELVRGFSRSELSIKNISEGIRELKSYLSSQILLVLDDIDHVNQLEALLPDEVKNAIDADSLILITSREGDVLAKSGVEKSLIYKLEGLTQEQSRELFCSHAFCKPYPDEGFESLVNVFVNYCQGLPLSLKVIGAHLYGEKNSSRWRIELDKFQRKLHEGIKASLQISYDGLDKYAQNIFLDIACFFIGNNKEIAIETWNGSNWAGLSSFELLQKRCLVEVDSANKIHMHDHLRDLGRDIAQSSLPHRLWCPKLNIEDLQEKSLEISKPVRGIRLVRSDFKDSDLKVAIRNQKLKLVDTEDTLLERVCGTTDFQEIVWVRWNKYPYTSLPSWILAQKLRVLQVFGGKLHTLWEDDSQVPEQLRQLEIHAPICNIPKSIGQLRCLERLVILVPHSEEPISVKELPAEFCDLRLLKALILTNCSKIKSLPERFGNLSNLEHINLSGCRNLERFPDSFGRLTCLKHLDLSGCWKLTISSITLKNITRLEYLNLCDCEQIEVLPPQVADQRSLEHLDLRGTNLKELPSAIGRLSNLETLEVGNLLLETLPASLSQLMKLNKFTSFHCPELKCLPHFGHLTELIVWDCPVRELNLSNLDSCIGLQYLELFQTKMSDVTFDEGACANLQRLKIHCCKDLVKVGTLPNGLMELTLQHCSNLREISGFRGLPKLESLHIESCHKVKQLQGIEALKSLTHLHAIRCRRLKIIGSELAQLTKLQVSFKYRVLS